MDDQILRLLVTHDIKEIALRMNQWFIRNNYMGNDPYQVDEKVFGKINSFPITKYIRKVLKPFHSYIPGSTFTKYPHIFHPKAVGLILAGNSSLYEITKDNTLLSENNKLLILLEELKSPGYKFFCWGHPFEWGQSPRYPKNTPFVCVTCPIAHGLLDFYSISGNNKALELSVSAAEGLMHENGYDNITENKISLYYSPIDRKYVYNSNIMAASFMYRLNKIQPEKKYTDFAEKLVNFVKSGQNTDGSWKYADERGEQRIDTIDNRHTAFILEALKIISVIQDDDLLTDVIQKGHHFYLTKLFDDNIPRWSPAKTYPVDIHDIANAIITLTRLGLIQKASDVLKFAIERMFNGNDAFYYKVFPNGNVNKAVFIRWGQAWMYSAITLLAKEINLKTS